MTTSTFFLFPLFLVLFAFEAIPTALLFGRIATGSMMACCDDAIFIGGWCGKSGMEKRMKDLQIPRISPICSIANSESICAISLRELRHEVMIEMKSKSGNSSCLRINTKFTIDFPTTFRFSSSITSESSTKCSNIDSMHEREDLKSS